MSYKTYWLAGLLAPMMVAPVAAVPSEIASSQFHTVFIDNGAVFGMGSNGSGEIAIATSPEHRTPYFTGFQNAKSVHANYNRTAIINKDGTAILVGKNWATNGYSKRSFPMSNITDIALTYKDTFFVSGGQLYRWSDTDATHLLISSNVKQIAGGHEHLVILFADGTVGTSGKNNRGQLGDGSTTNAISIKKLALTSISDIAAGANTSFARTSTSNVYAWGANTQSELGNGGQSDQTIPVDLKIQAKKVLPGMNHTVLIREDNSAWAAGWHNYISGAIYNTNKTYVQLPIGSVLNASSGGDHTMIMTGKVGQVHGWGGNVFGKLGDGTNTERHTLATAFFTPIPAAPGGSTENPVCTAAKQMSKDKISLNVAITCQIPIYTSMNQCLKANKRIQGAGEFCKALIIPADRGNGN